MWLSVPAGRLRWTFVLSAHADQLACLVLHMRFFTDGNGLGLAATTPIFARLGFLFLRGKGSEAIAE